MIDSLYTTLTAFSIPFIFISPMRKNSMKVHKCEFLQKSHVSFDFKSLSFDYMYIKLYIHSQSHFVKCNIF